MKKRIVSLCLAIILLMSFGSAFALTLDRTKSYYSDYSISGIRYQKQYFMNCYAYALQVYCNTFDHGDGSTGYLLYPGEFYDWSDSSSTETFANLRNSYNLAGTTWNNMLQFVKDRVYENFRTLAKNTAEWTVKDTTASATVPSGYRKIALSVRQDGKNSDFHFYMRHSDGKWSHKRGTTLASDYSISGSQVLTDSNIDTYARQAPYDDGTVYLLIGKSAVIDYPHGFGHNNNSVYTPVLFKDRAGDSLEKSAVITNSWYSNVDYLYDVDCFEYTPTTGGYYSIFVSAGSTCDFDGFLSDSNGNLIAYDTAAGANFSIRAYLTAGNKYYIKCTCTQYHENEAYTLYITKS